jgi:hypothetical protein
MPRVPGTLLAEDAQVVPLVVKLLQDLTRVAATAVLIGQTNDALITSLVKYTNKLLYTGKTLEFITKM